MAGKRRTRIDSAEEQGRIVKAALAGIEPPAHVPLEPADLVFFDSVIGEAGKSEWTPHSIELAAILARTMADLAREQILMREEGSLVASQSGAMVANPRKAIIQMHSAAILSTRRSLGIHARAQSGEARAIAKRREVIRDFEGQSFLADELIARPS